MTSRTYGEACGLAHALDLVGERWAMLVVRELLLGPKRFSDLGAGLAGASPNVLSERLRQLERVGVVRRRRLGPPARAWVYELTEWGRELEPIMLALGTWGVRSPYLDGAGHVSVDSIVLALRTYFTTDATDWDASYEVRFGEDRFAVRVSGGAISVERGSPADPDATIATDARTFRDLLGNGPLLGELAGGAVTLTGDAVAAERLFAAVRVPGAVPAPA
jgi:DNA-binding HxlR family transcriptional regulator